MSTTTLTETAKQPDITYHPDPISYAERTKRILAKNPPQVLPPGFPSKLESELVWERKDFKDGEWIYHLTEADVEEVRSAVEQYKSQNLPLGLLSPETFVLPRFSKELQRQAHILHSGRGFFVLRGMPEYQGALENTISYVGVASHIGPTRGIQDPNGAVLAHITDLRSQAHNTNAIGTPAYTPDKQVFHTDPGDIISLYVLGEAARGGTSRVASSWKVYNHLASTRPDIVNTLSKPWPFDGFGGNPKVYYRPLIHFHDGRLVSQYARRKFTGFKELPRSADIPPITEEMAEALDALHFTAEKFALELHFRRGDVQFINNLSVFHARDGYTDDETHK
ncbi:Clavaminate synthase-like protein [Choiromyces venosus 120613-1]|nr:Clavaminate synthase-like protein [Choiromyces venosus 120613-1]